MHASVLLLCGSLLYILLVAGMYFSKQRVDSSENQIYSYLLFVGIFGIILDLFGIFVSLKLPDTHIFRFLILKSYYSYLLTVLYLISLYIFQLKKDIGNGLKVFLRVIYVGANIINFLMPFKFFRDGNIIYAYGANVTFLYSLAVVVIIIWVIYILFNIKIIRKRRVLPIVIFVILSVPVILFQMTNPEYLLITALITYIIIFMYFTIENPDIKMIRELEVAREQAVKANRAKTDFLSSMSHEIRTPLNAIVGFSDCIMEAESLEEAKENAHDVVNASQTLLEIVNGILDISKIEAGKIEIVNSAYNANEVFLELARLITPKMKEKGLDFSFNIAEDLPATLYGDHANLKKVITNLLSNACKYTDRGFVHYEVNCVNSKDVCKLIISVEDSGRGIKNENIDKMFTKFQRLDVDRNTTIEGTGLGLAITKQLMELMGGRIIVHTVYGEGSKFTIVVNQKIEKTEVLSTKKVKTSLDLHDIKILIVDDTELNLKVASKILERYNANMVECCDSGYSCLEKIRAGNEYDLIFLDDMMPKMNGVETLKELKKIPNFKSSIIALTANAISGMKEKYIEDGFDDYLAKPIEKEQLIHVVNNVLGRSITETIEIPKEEIEQSMNKQTNIIPVVDIDIPIESLENVDRSYLESNGVDINHALKLLGDMDMYNMTINDFMGEIEDKWKRIVEYKNKNDMENYQIEVHSLKSDCKYLGFMTLADIAYEHELKSKEKDSVFVNNNFEKLENEYKKVLNIVRTYVENNK